MIKKPLLVILSIYSILSCNTIQIPVSRTSPTVVVPTAPAPQLTEPTVLKMGSSTWGKEQIKQQIKLLGPIDSVESDKVLAKLIKKELFTLEAKAQGYDKKDLFDEELETYKQVILEKQSQDKKLLNLLKEECYQHSQSELKVRQIFVALDEYQTDTLPAYHKMKIVQERLKNGESFELLAKEVSEDPISTEKGGDLGWISALQIYYPLEVALYELKEQEISPVTRSKKGLHIFKLEDKRPNSGKVKVQQVFKKLSKDSDFKELTHKIAELDSIKLVLDQGQNFDEMVIKHSDEPQAAQSLGILPIFGVGTQDSYFEQICFSLHKGQNSTSFQTDLGLHLIRVLEKYPAPSKNQFFEENEYKFTSDSRKEYLANQKIKALKDSSQLKVINYQEVTQYANSALKNRIWAKPNNSNISQKKLLQWDSQVATQENFFDYILEKQLFEKWSDKYTPSQIMTLLFDKFVHNQVHQFEKNKLLEENQELKEILQLQRDNLLYSRFYADQIINKSLTDTTGQHQYFEQNKMLFPSKDEGRIHILSYRDDSIKAQFEKLMDSHKPYRLFRGISPMLFEKNQAELENEQINKLETLIRILNQQLGYIVEISGHSDINEDAGIAQERVKSVVNYLTSKGIPLTRVIEIDQKDNKPISKKSAEKNQRIAFQFFSNYESDLIQLINQKEPRSITFKSGFIEKKEFEKHYSEAWKSGRFSINTTNRIEDVALTVLPISNKFENHKSSVIPKYQKVIEERLFRELYQKYMPQFKLAELKEIIDKQKN